jgi:tubulin-specific chaperone A
MASQAELIKSLKVKSGSVKRTHKELTMYEKDREKQQAKVDKLKADNADSHNIKQAVCQEHMCKHVWFQHVAESWQHSFAVVELPRSHIPPQENVAAEAAMMIPETRQRLETAFTDLQSFLVC